MRPKKKKPRKPRRSGPPITPNRFERETLEVDADLIRRYLNLYCMTPIGELQKLAKNPALTFAERSIIKVMVRIDRTADIYALNALYDRLIGPLLRKFQVSTGANPYEKMTVEELLAEKARLDVENQKTVKALEKEQVMMKQIAAGTYVSEEPRWASPTSPESEIDKTGSG